MRTKSYSIDFLELPVLVNEVSCKSSVIAPLLVDTLPCVDCEPCVVVHDITYIASNLNKFSDISDIQQSAIIDRLRSVGGDTFDKFSDDELFSTLKSRYSQLPAEVNSYIDYINNNIDLVKSDITRETLKANAPDVSSVPADSSADVVSQ